MNSEHICKMLIQLYLYYLVIGDVVSTKSSVGQHKKIQNLDLGSNQIRNVSSTASWKFNKSFLHRDVKNFKLNEIANRNKIINNSTAIPQRLATRKSNISDIEISAAMPIQTMSSKLQNITNDVNTEKYRSVNNHHDDTSYTESSLFFEKLKSLQPIPYNEHPTTMSNFVTSLPNDSTSNSNSPYELLLRAQIDHNDLFHLQAWKSKKQQTLRLVAEENRYHQNAAKFAASRSSKSKAEKIGEPDLVAPLISKEEGKIGLRVYVSKHGVIVTANDEQIYRSWNRTWYWNPTKTFVRLHAGVHLLALSAQSGKLLRAANFMTWQMASAAHLMKEIQAISEGRILMLIGAPDFVQELTASARQLVTGLGSELFGKMVQYESYLLVTRTGGRVLYEAARTKQEDELDWNKVVKGEYWDGPPMTVDMIVDALVKARCPDSSGQSAAHRLFCERYEGYGAFCACDATLQQYLEQQEGNSSLPIIAVALVGALRTPYVLEQIRTIRQNTAGQRVPLVMCLDGDRDEPEALAKLLNVSVVKYTEDNIRRGTLSRINTMIQFSVTKVFEVFPDVQLAIILEDDVQLSPDFIPFFRQTAGLLADPHELLLCVNAYNTHSYPETASNYSRLYRHQGTPAYGWMITRAVGKEMEEMDFWPAEYNPSDWDYYFRAKQLGSRHVLAPEVSRSRHVGSGGVHITGTEQERYYNRRMYNSNYSYVKMDVESVRRTPYLRYHEQRIRDAVQLNFSRTHPCSDGLMDGYPDNTPFVAFLYVTGEDDDDRALEVVLKCLENADRGFHENLYMMILLHPQQRPLYLVGCPASPFCTFSKSHVYYKPTKTDIDYTEKLYYNRVPYLTKLSYRKKTDKPWDMFMLNNTHHVVMNVYVSH